MTRRPRTEAETALWHRGQRLSGLFQALNDGLGPRNTILKPQTDEIRTVARQAGLSQAEVRRAITAYEWGNYPDDYNVPTV